MWVGIFHVKLPRALEKDRENESERELGEVSTERERERERERECELRGSSWFLSVALLKISISAVLNFCLG